MQNTQGSLSVCKSKCEAKEGCNAINHKSNACVLRKCALTIPQPRANVGGHVGFTGYKIQGIKLAI